MRSVRRTLSLVAAAVIIVAAGAGASATTANAAPANGVEYVVKVTHRASNLANFNKLLGSCSGSAGVVCTIKKSVEVSRTVQQSFGLSVSFISAKIDISNVTKVSVSVKCSWELPTSSSRLYAYPLGEEVFYKITKNTYSGGRLVSSTSSGTLMAFVPEQGSAFCARVR